MSRLHRCHACGWRGWGTETVPDARQAEPKAAAAALDLTSLDETTRLR